MDLHLRSDLPKKKVSIILLNEWDKGIPLVTIFNRQKGGDSWWDLIGGKRDPIIDGGVVRLETDLEAAYRELREEAGVTAEASHFKKLFKQLHRHPKTPDTETRFLVVQCPAGQIPQNLEQKDHLKMEHHTPTKALEMLGNRVSTEVADYLASLGGIYRPK